MFVIKRKFIGSIMLLVIWLMGALPGLAQDNDNTTEARHPLIEMLSIVPPEAAFVPPDAEQLTWIGYNDLRANEQARPGVVTSPDMAAFLAAPEADQDLWLANYQRLIGTTSDLQSNNILSLGKTKFRPEMADYWGFDIFEVDQTLHLEAFASRWQYEIFRGHFDTQQIIETLVSRTYTKTTSHGFPVVCGPVGCEHGVEAMQFLPDQQGRDPVTLIKPGVFPVFGQEHGRQQPIALGANTMFSSPSWDTLEAMTAAAQGSQLSVYDLPDYRAITDFAVTESADGLLIQVLYFDPSWFSAENYVYSLLATLQRDSEDLTSAQMVQLADELKMDVTAWPDLPVYALAALVDRQDGPDQVAHLVLAYDTEADAQQAAEIATRRITEQSAFTLVDENVPLLDYLELDYTLEPGRVEYAAATDRWLAITTLRSPLPSNELDPEDGRIRGSGGIWPYWMFFVNQRQFLPFVVTLSD